MSGVDTVMSVRLFIVTFAYEQQLLHTYCTGSDCMFS